MGKDTRYFNLMISLSVFVVIVGSQYWVVNGVSVYDLSIAISYVLLFGSIFFFDRHDPVCIKFLFWLSYFPMFKLTKEIAGVASEFYVWEYYLFGVICLGLYSDIYWKKICVVARQFRHWCKQKLLGIKNGYH